MKNALIILAVVVVLGGGYYYWYTHQAMSEPMVTDTTAQNGAGAGKLNINVVCDGALAYMTFPDGDAAAKFVAECKAGEHPEVIEQYKKDHNLDGATI